MSDDTLFNVAAAVGLLLAGAPLLAALFLRRRRRLRWILALLALPPLIGAGILFWYAHRPLPAPLRETLFQGIEYIREVRSTPRALVIHVVLIDLDAPGLHFLVTPGGEDTPAQTASQFLDSYDLQLAINGDGFQPSHDGFPWDYYPRTGDPVSTRGLAASEGTVYTRGISLFYDTLFIGADNRVAINAPSGDMYNAISGTPLLLHNGRNQVTVTTSAFTTTRHPRTAVGIDESGRVLILILVDGRQPNYSEGVTVSELTDLLREYGAREALNLDGGGSSTLVIEGADGTPQVLNSPIHGRIPGRERPTANQLGV